MGGLATIVCCLPDDDSSAKQTSLSFEIIVTSDVCTWLSYLQFSFCNTTTTLSSCHNQNFGSGFKLLRLKLKLPWSYQIAKTYGSKLTLAKKSAKPTRYFQVDCHRQTGDQQLLIRKEIGTNHNESRLI